MRAPQVFAASITASSLVMAGLSGAALAGAGESSPLHTLVDTAAQRLQTAEPVAAFKWINGAPINDPPRVQVVFDGVGTEATAHQLDLGCVH
ncbi:chorismate mutase family protein [Mycolicibacterium mengxianglii]|uniref:hypothetical protein n=1 Tax=Mycolicibacterium mengxianglii TaxID=2736649 RepID=UPI0018EF0B49|nr:hypothetical protein [Mycolicibacterium mengxianglii]